MFHSNFYTFLNKLKITAALFIRCTKFPTHLIPGLVKETTTFTSCLYSLIVKGKVMLGIALILYVVMLCHSRSDFGYKLLDNAYGRLMINQSLQPPKSPVLIHNWIRSYSHDHIHTNHDHIHTDRRWPSKWNSVTVQMMLGYAA